MGTLIDYYGDSAEVESSPTSFQGMREYWMKAYESKVGGIYQWSIKDQTLLSRLMKEYSTEDIVPLVDHYFRFYKSDNYTFGRFYLTRQTIYEELNKPENYGFD